MKGTRSTHLPVFIGCMILISMPAAAPLLAGGEREPAGREGEPDMREVTFMLDWVPNVNHVGIFAAEENGYFRDAGLDVDIIQPGEVRAVSAVAGGRAEFGVDFQENITLLRADNVPVVSVAAVLQTNTSGFAVRAGEGIESPADFEGLDYGTFQSPFERPTLDALVRCAGGDPTTIDYVPAGTELLAMLQQEKADIAWIFYGTQGFQAQRIGLDIQYFPLNEYADCIPDYYTPVIIASE
ncbi:MAG: ABC transporter substrate-binding protein, partial [Spirochaetes bacterium]|nr:ABC transporter substrate-binding protein [Spirochaetota bacterium]